MHLPLEPEPGPFSACVIHQPGVNRSGSSRHGQEHTIDREERHESVMAPLFAQQRQPGHGAVQHVVDQPSRSESSLSRHGQRITSCQPRVQKKSCVPFDIGRCVSQGLTAASHAMAQWPSFLEIAGCPTNTPVVAARLSSPKSGAGRYQEAPSSAVILSGLPQICCCGGGPHANPDPCFGPTRVLRTCVRPLSRRSPDRRVCSPR